MRTPQRTFLRRVYRCVVLLSGLAVFYAAWFTPVRGIDNMWVALASNVILTAMAVLFVAWALSSEGEEF